jgi:hypothetical protein
MTFKKVEVPSEGVSTSREQDTNAYKFKVEMVVTLFAENEYQAAEQLDANGGFVIARDVKLLETTEIHKAKADEKE